MFIAAAAAENFHQTVGRCCSNRPFRLRANTATCILSWNCRGLGESAKIKWSSKGEIAGIGRRGKEREMGNGLAVHRRRSSLTVGKVRPTPHCIVGTTSRPGSSTSPGVVCSPIRSLVRSSVNQFVGFELIAVGRQRSVFVDRCPWRQQQQQQRAATAAESALSPVAWTCCRPTVRRERLTPEYGCTRAQSCSGRLSLVAARRRRRQRIAMATPAPSQSGKPPSGNEVPQTGEYREYETTTSAAAAAAIFVY